MQSLIPLLLAGSFYPGRLSEEDDSVGRIVPGDQPQRCSLDPQRSSLRIDRYGVDQLRLSTANEFPCVPRGGKPGGTELLRGDLRTESSDAVVATQELVPVPRVLARPAVAGNGA